ncbi:hypothetical protein C8J57DRAFT_151434 [Mycena rebaudengoi]|nr:hypothetical protein C8J57DRAFT_151434 [Mycena rebaudengoi]
MRSFNAFTLVTLASIVFAVTNPTGTATQPIGIDGDVEWKESTVRRSTPQINHIAIKRDAASALTNAQRLARGLSPLPPKRRNGRAPLARRSAGPPVTKTGRIMVTNTNTNAFLGYVSQNNTSFNHFGRGGEAVALTFQLTVDSTVRTSPTIDIRADSSYGSIWPFMGGICGVVTTSCDLNPGSINYVFIQGTGQSAPNAPPSSISNSYPSSELAESAIWTYDALTGALKPQWVNTDGSKRPSFIQYVTSTNALVITGDRAAFGGVFTSLPVSFTLI